MFHGVCCGRAVRYMYVRQGSRAAKSTDTHVQLPEAAGRSTSAAGFTGTGNNDAGTTQPDPPAHSWMLKHATGIAHPILPPPTPDEPSIYFP